MSPRRDAGAGYLARAARRAGVTLDQLADAVKVQRCGGCGSAYCDPWLTPEASSALFTVDAPDHIAGWANFEQWLSSDRPNRPRAAARELWKVLSPKLGVVDSYAELACPFQGLLLEFKASERSVSERIGAFKAAVDGRCDARWTTSTKLHMAGERLADLLTLAYHRVRAFKERGGERPALPVPGRRLLLTRETSRGWGANCTRYGMSCRAGAASLLSADVQPFDAFARSGGTLDLLGIFNGLDHLDDPVGTLKTALGFSRFVVVATHRAADAGKQHLFAFADDFPRWLAGALPGATVEDLTPALAAADPGNRYLLLSRKP